MLPPSSTLKRATMESPGGDPTPVGSAVSGLTTMLPVTAEVNLIVIEVPGPKGSTSWTSVPAATEMLYSPFTPITETDPAAPPAGGAGAGGGGGTRLIESLAAADPFP